MSLQTINGCRDTAQHHLLDISEQQLYIHAQSGVTSLSRGYQIRTCPLYHLTKWSSGTMFLCLLRWVPGFAGREGSNGTHESA